MEVHWQEWVKGSYLEVPVEGPNAKRLKFSTILEKLSAQFPSDTITTAVTSQAVQRVFPSSQKKRIGHERLTYVLGIGDVVHKEKPTVAGSFTQQDLKVQNKLLSDRVFELEVRVCELENTKLAILYQQAETYTFGSNLIHCCTIGMQILCGPIPLPTSVTSP